MDVVLVINAGSSSVKFQVFELAASGEPQRLVKGKVDGIGTHPRFHAEARDRSPLIDDVYSPGAIADVATAITVIRDWLRAAQTLHVVAAGHRVVHGGPLYASPVLVTSEVLDRLQQYEPWAPLHQPHNLAPMRFLHAQHPEIPQVACFDTAFHRGHDAVAERFAIPEQLYSDGVRRYGFHGLSYEYIAGRLREIAPQIAKGRVIVAHLGSGASMCAIAGGKSIESTMGFSALDGLPMGTRPGQIDPGVLLYLMTEKGMDAAALQHFLYHECGLQGLSGLSSDMRDLEASGSPGASLAIDHFVYRIGLNAGMLTAALDGLDAFVFTAGIGENSAVVRAKVIEKMRWLGASIDPSANARNELVISDTASRLKIYVIPTDEELMIARHTLSLLGASNARSERPAERLGNFDLNQSSRASVAS